MTAAIESLRERGFTEATLWVAAANHRPRRIYEVAGWRLDGVARDRQWRGATVRDVRYRNSLWPSAAGPCRALSQTSRRLRQCS
jgi:RimJ/RimL family protein N-acetyltransferase